MVQFWQVNLLYQLICERMTLLSWKHYRFRPNSTVCSNAVGCVISFRPAERRVWPLVVSLTLGVLTLGACGSPVSTTSLPCPDVSILAGSERLVLFKPGTGRDIIDILVEADMSNLGAACEYDDLRVDVETAFEIVAARGPKAGTSQVIIVFFAAIINPDGQVIAKETFESRIEFPENRRRVGVREQVVQQIPLKAQATGQDYQILVGFQLTPDQLEYNQSRWR